MTCSGTRAEANWSVFRETDGAGSVTPATASGRDVERHPHKAGVSGGVGWKFLPLRAFPSCDRIFAPAQRGPVDLVAGMAVCTARHAAITIGLLRRSDLVVNRQVHHGLHEGNVAGKGLLGRVGAVLERQVPVRRK